MTESREPITDEQQERIARYLAGALSGPERASLEREALSSDALTEALYGHGTLVARAHRRARRQWRHVLPVAAALLFTAGLFRWHVGRQAGELRGPPEGAPRLVAPLGTFPDLPVTFRWTRVPAAERYRLEVLDGQLRLVWRAVTPDTFVTSTRGGALDTLQSMVWKVTAIDSAGRELRTSRPAQIRRSEAAFAPPPSPCNGLHLQPPSGLAELHDRGDGRRPGNNLRGGPGPRPAPRDPRKRPLVPFEFGGNMRPAATLAVLLLLMPDPTRAALAPTTPTFSLAWGNLGTAAGQFNQAMDIAVDTEGNLYVADFNNHRIQKFDPLGNPIRQWGTSGAGDGQFNGPHGIATDPSGNVYVVEFNNHRVQKFTGDGHFITKWGTNGSGDGQFNAPWAVATDAAGNVYVADRSNHRVQKFSSTGVFLMKWGGFGTGNGQFDLPLGVAVDRSGHVYVADRNNNRVQKFTAAGAFVAKWGSLGTGDGQFNNPTGVAMDALGHIYVLDQINHRVQKFTKDGTFVTKWGSNGTASGQFSSPVGLTVDAAGNVYVADLNNHRVQKFSGAGAPLATAPPTMVQQWVTPLESRHHGLTVDREGAIFAVDWHNSRVIKYSNTGSLLTSWGGLGSADGTFRRPHGAAMDSGDTDLYVADTNNHRIQMFTANGGFLLKWGSEGSGNGQFIQPSDVAVDALGYVYIADSGNHRIQKFTSTGGYVSQWGSFGAGPGQFNTPMLVAVDRVGGYVYVADANNYRIQKFSSTGVFILQWGSQGAGDNQFGSMHGLATDRRGYIFVSDGMNVRTQKFTGGGVLHSSWRHPFYCCLALDLDSSGNLFAGGSEHVTKFVAPPEIALISDVDNDQGRQAQLRIRRSSADARGSGVTVTGYEIHRRIEPLPVTAPTSAAGNPWALEPDGAQIAGWHYLLTVPAHGESEYNVVVPTLANANRSSVYYTQFFVRAATSDPFMFFDSAPEHGYSIDNLSPPAPTPFTAGYVAGATHLHWGVSTASDFRSFSLYRGASADFIPEPSNLVATTTDTGYVDAGPAGSYYKLSAIDFDGNESPFATVGPNQTVDMGETSLTFGLEPLRPNPASGSELLVRFALPGSAPARLELLDVAGRRVVVREVGTLGAGRHAVDLTGGRVLPAGIYHVRLTAGRESRSGRVAVIR